MTGNKLLFLMLVCGAGGASAQGTAYPLKPVRIIVPSSPGGGTDILARVLAQKMADSLGQQFVVENRPGAGQVIGIEAVARAAPDGYTLLMAASAIVINEVLYAKPPYDTLRDFAPVTLGASLPNILVVHPALPVKSVRELIALATTRPGQLNYSSAGGGTLAAFVDGIVPHHGGYCADAHTVQGHRTGHHRSCRGAGAVVDAERAHRIAADQRRQIARARRDRQQAGSRAAGHSGDRRDGARL